MEKEENLNDKNISTKKNVEEETELKADVENSEAMAQYQEIKQLLAQQRRSWQLTIEKLA